MIKNIFLYKHNKLINNQPIFIYDEEDLFLLSIEFSLSRWLKLPTSPRDVIICLSITLSKNLVNLTALLDPGANDLWSKQFWKFFKN